MGKLEAVFQIQLAYPLIRMGVIKPEVVVAFPGTGNTVRISPPEDPPTPTDLYVGGGLMTLRVQRECTESEAQTFHLGSGKFEIERDAARAFWQLFEAMRESASVRDNTVFIYPVVPVEILLRNPLVRECKFEVYYEGKLLADSVQRQSVPAIEITEERWGDAVRMLKDNEPVPVFRRFVSDAFYFADDPVRSIIMSCAAWEIALRHYLANVASRRDPAYDVASNMRGIPTLVRFAEKARGGSLFYDWPTQAETEQASSDVERDFKRTTLEQFKKLMEGLPSNRNKLLHSGEAELSAGIATDYALAVHAAINWLLAGEASG